MRTKQEFKRVQSDLILLDIRVHKHHRLDLVIDAVPDKVKLKDELLSKDEAVVSLTEKLVEEVVILFEQLLVEILSVKAHATCKGLRAFKGLMATKLQSIVDIFEHGFLDVLEDRRFATISVKGAAALLLISRLQALQLALLDQAFLPSHVAFVQIEKFGLFKDLFCQKAHYLRIYVLLIDA